MENTETVIVTDSLSAQAAALGLTPLEKPFTTNEAIKAADPYGVLVAIVEITFEDLLSAREIENDGEEGLVARRLMEDSPTPYQLEFECIGARNGNPLVVARFDVADTLFDKDTLGDSFEDEENEDFDGDISDEELAEIRASGAV